MQKLIKLQYVTITLWVSLAAVLGSFYFSEVLNLPPCKACWYQRVFTIAMLLVSIVAKFTKEVKAYTMLLVLAIPGWIIALFQTLDEQLGTNLLRIVNCSNTECTDVTFKLLGVFSIPMLALIMFTLLIVMLGYVAWIYHNDK